MGAENYRKSGQIPAFGDWENANELPITQAGLLRCSCSGECGGDYANNAAYWGGGGGGNPYGVGYEKPLPRRLYAVPERKNTNNMSDGEIQTTKTDPNELTLQIANLVQNSNNVSLGFKLDDNNYALWARLMKVAIRSRGKSGHITGQPPPPKKTDPNYYKWEEADLSVFSWLLQNMEGKLVLNFAQHQTAKAVWDSLVVTYGSETTDPFQIYDLEVRANKVNQGQLTLEDYWNNLQTLWLNIDRRDPNPIGCCEEGIAKYQKLIETRRLFQFLSGLDAKYDNIRRDILKEYPSPSAESAYSKVRREAARLLILQPTTTRADSEIASPGGIATGLAATRPTFSLSEGPLPPNATLSQQNRSGTPSQRKKENKSKLHCSHCGMQRHTEEMCFQIVGYPEWWDNNHKTAKGKVAVTVDNPKIVGSAVAVGESHHPMDEMKGAAGTGKTAQMTKEKGFSGYQDMEDYWTWH